MIYHFIKQPILLAVSFSILLTACGAEESETDTTDNPSSVVFQQRSLAITSTCSFGGVELDTGIDVNLNGVLDASEISNTELICNGEPGLSALIQTVSLPAGDSCVHGGVTVQSGQDLNGNLMLDDIEVKDSTAICNLVVSGLDGENGVDGTDGLLSLVDIITEAPGDSCISGGQAIKSGLDINTDNLLNEGEVSKVSYICNGVNAQIFTALVSHEVTDMNETCPNGGVIITSGLDENSNSILDPSEIANTNTVCHGSRGSNGTDGADGTNGTDALVSITVEEIGNNCGNGGYAVMVTMELMVLRPKHWFDRNL